MSVLLLRWDFFFKTLGLLHLLHTAVYY